MTARTPRHPRRADPHHGAMALTTPPPASPPGAVVVRAFLDGHLGAERWDHPAHLAVCHHLLAEEGEPEAAVTRMRPLIQSHNARVGVKGRGYHETITRFYVWAVHHADAASPEDLLADPALDRGAPLRHWSPTALGSPEAATGWVEPDRAPLPWSAAPPG